MLKPSSLGKEWLVKITSTINYNISIGFHKMIIEDTDNDTFTESPTSSDDDDDVFFVRHVYFSRRTLILLRQVFLVLVTMIWLISLESDVILRRFISTGPSTWGFEASMNLILFLYSVKWNSKVVTS